MFNYFNVHGVITKFLGPHSHESVKQICSFCVRQDICLRQCFVNSLQKRKLFARRALGLIPFFATTPFVFYSSLNSFTLMD